VQIVVRPVALGRAVANLIDNAFTYGEPPVVLRLRRQPQHCTVEVWDQGAGMASPQWERALQPFQRLDEARGQQGHCGLGLAIVAHVAQLHGGSLQQLHGEPPTAPGRFGIALALPCPGNG
jgi:two-component system osmolarity sensor histidine kinase EnvZ